MLSNFFINHRFSTYDSHSELCDAVRLSRSLRRAGWGCFLRAESFYNVATQEEEYAKGPFGVPSDEFHKKSHGESFQQIAQKQFKPNGLYILDEPEAALSPQRQLTLLLEIVNCAKEDSPQKTLKHARVCWDCFLSGNRMNDIME